MFLFVDSNCSPCKTLASRLDDVSQRDGVRIYAVLDDSDDARSFPVPDGVPRYYDTERRAARAFQNRTTPYAYAVDGGGRVAAREVVGSTDDLKRLARIARGGDA